MQRNEKTGVRVCDPGHFCLGESSPSQEPLLDLVPDEPGLDPGLQTEVERVVVLVSEFDILPCAYEHTQPTDGLPLLRQPMQVAVMDRACKGHKHR